MAKQGQMSGEKGNFALLAALVLGLLVGFFALVVDVGVMYWTSDREEDVAESAALAAVRELDQTAGGLDRARTAARNLLAHSDPNNEFAFNSSTDVVFGTWNGSSFTASATPSAINAVRVNVERNATKGNSVRPLVAGVLGLFSNQAPRNVNVNGFSIAATAPNGAPGNANIFPVAVNSCDLSRTGTPYSAGGSLACGREIVFGEDPQIVETQCSCHCFDVVVAPSFTVNPSDARVVSLNATSGSSNSINSTSFSTMLNDLVACKKNNDSAACTRIQANLNSNIAVSSDRNVLSPSANVTNFNALLASGGMNVQVPVMGDSCTPSAAVTPSPVITPVIPSYSYYAIAPSASNNNQIVGFATLNVTEISTGSKRYIRAQVVCDQKITGNSTAPAGSQSFGTVVQNQGRLVRTPAQVAPAAPVVPAPVVTPVVPAPVVVAPAPVYTPPAWGCY